MIALPFRRLSERDRLFAEAQALVDDGLDVDFVLSLYPDDAWLESLLRTSETVIGAARAEEPSYYFEASLKARFIAAGEARARGERQPVTAVPAPATFGAFAGARTAAASLAVAGVASVLGVVTLGFVTADGAVPGDWNYAFKLAGERLEYSLADGDERVGVELRHKQERVYEVQQLVRRGEVDTETIERLRKELQEIAELQQEAELDPVQKATVRAVGESSAEILTTVRQQKPELAPVIDNAIAAAAGISGATVTAIDEPTPSPTAEPATPVATPSVAPATETPAATETPTPEPVETVETVEPTAEPSPTRTPNDPIDADPDPSATQADAAE